MSTLKPGKKLIRLKISKTLQRKIRRGYPWVFDYQLLDMPDSGTPGNLAVIYDDDNRFLAIGLFDPDSEIRLRILQTREPAIIGPALFRTRLQKAWDARRFLERNQTTGYRIVNGESDGLPGLVVDRYAETFVLKIYTSSWYPYLKSFVRLMKNDFPVRRCVLRLSRKIKNPLFQDGQILLGSPFDGKVRFRENGLEFQADVLRGQKTGFYFDQRNNRAQIKTMSKNKKVLNVFSYSGGFSVYAFSGGCRSVCEIDSNSNALNAARKNIHINFPNLLKFRNRFRQVRGDGMDQLVETARTGKSFDLVILDPPAFARKKDQVPQALQAYSRLAEVAAQVTQSGGILFAASCSNPIKNKDFFDSVQRGIGRSGKQEKAILKTGQPDDHPARFEEGSYLKAGYWQINSP